MAIDNATPFKWTPLGVSDTLDASNTFTGAMAAMTNLIPDRTTRGLWVCRPASILKTSFAGFNTPLFVSVMMIVGNRAYGMVSTQRNPAKDEPFSYNLLTGAFDAVSNVTNANTPTSPATTGAWTPPRMALIGTRIIVTHQGFVGSANFFGWINITNPAAPAWDAGNTATNPLTVVPVDVFNYRGRAYYAVNTANVASTPFSDILDPLTITNASQVLTYDDNVPITCFGGLPLNTTLGQIVTTLVVFKGVADIYFVTGDAATLDLSKNNVNSSTGTLSPNSLFPSTKGLGFISPEGLRFIDFSGNVSHPVGADGDGVYAPFIFAVEPSRIVASCNGETVKMSVQNGNALGAPNEEYWYDITRDKWSGPHTFAASLIQPWAATFVKTPIGVLGKLFQSDPAPSLTSTYVENGAAMPFVYKSPQLPDTEQMCENAVCEATLDLAFTAGSPGYTVYALDENDTVLDTLTLTIGGTPVLWGQFNWGQANWLGAPQAIAPRNLAWHQPIVFRRVKIQVNGTCSSQAKFGTLRMRYQQLGYLQAALGGSA